MELLFEVVFEFLAELALQFFVQALGGIGSNMLNAHRARGPRHPAVSLLGHAVVGAALGALTLVWFPHSFAHSEFVRIGTLIASPLATGLLTAIIGTRRRHAGRTTVLIETFSYGFLFAFTFALVRFFATT
jgi:hypothetical protein